MTSLTHPGLYMVHKDREIKSTEVSVHSLISLNHSFFFGLYVAHVYICAQESDGELNTRARER